jgi:tetratricopeptide (TPR) repeat protein
MMKRIFCWLLCVFVNGNCLAFADAASVQELLNEGDRLAQADEKFPESLKQAIEVYKQALAVEPQNPLPQIRIARAYLALGDGLEKDVLPWYERGEAAAERALALKEDSAEAHFYLAANRGKAVNMRPFWKVSPGIVAELEKHLLRAIELDPRHSRALHMMAMLLDRTPGPLRMLLTGKKEQVEDYLKRAVAANPGYAYIEWSAAEYYREAGRSEQARQHAKVVVAMTAPLDRRLWQQQYRPAAEALLKTLAAP